MILVALTCACLFALLWPQPPRVTLYLWAKLYGNLAIFTVARFWGDTALTYGIIYAIVTIAILLAIAVIVTEAVRTRQNSWKAVGIVAVLSVTVGRLAVAALGHPAGYQDFIGIIEGSFLFGAGLALGALAPYLERWDLALVLSGLWLAQSFFRLGFYINGWWMLNWRVPPALGVVSFLLIGWLGRRRSHAFLRCCNYPDRPQSTRVHHKTGSAD